MGCLYHLNQSTNADFERMIEDSIYLLLPRCFYGRFSRVFNLYFFQPWRNGFLLDLYRIFNLFNFSQAACILAFHIHGLKVPQ